MPLSTLTKGLYKFHKMPGLSIWFYTYIIIGICSPGIFSTENGRSLGNYYKGICHSIVALFYFILFFKILLSLPVMRFSRDNKFKSSDVICIHFQN